MGQNGSFQKGQRGWRGWAGQSWGNWRTVVSGGLMKKLAACGKSEGGQVL